MIKYRSNQWNKNEMLFGLCEYAVEKWFDVIRKTNNNILFMKSFALNDDFLKHDDELLWKCYIAVYYSLINSCKFRKIT